MDLDGMKSATPVRATRLHARMAYVDNTSKHSYTSPIPQSLTPADNMFTHAPGQRMNPHITIGEL
jgi:hypothetical protein